MDQTMIVILIAHCTFNREKKTMKSHTTLELKNMAHPESFFTLETQFWENQLEMVSFGFV